MTSHRDPQKPADLTPEMREAIEEEALRLAKHLMKLNWTNAHRERALGLPGALKRLAADLNAEPPDGIGTPIRTALVRRAQAEEARRLWSLVLSHVDASRADLFAVRGHDDKERGR